MPTLTARTLITAIGTVSYPVIEVDSAGLITDISSDPGIRSQAILTPTFLDIHIHGAVGFDVMSASPAGMRSMERFLASRGTAHFLPTTVTAPVEDTLKALDCLADSIEAPIQADAATPIGIHLEGPFLSHAKRGVHPPDLLQRPSIALFDRFQEAARGRIKLLTLAPELAGTRDANPEALALIGHAAAQGVRVSLGHTDATAAQAEAAIQAGAVSTTHLFNAMRPLSARDPGIVGVALDSPELYSELICDGIHVDPLLVRLWLRLKGDHAILITDAMAATGMPDGDYKLGLLDVSVSSAGGVNGIARASLRNAPETLAGSVLTLDRAVENLRTFTQCDLATAVRCASSQPAAMLGLADTLSSVRVGQPANLNEFTSDGRLQTTYLRGLRVDLDRTG
jgi:N-acetylglucosamine-6-phosphate deacetylase